MTPIIECCDLVKTFPGCRAVGGISLQIPRGRIVGLWARTEAEKSTFLKLCNGLLTPDSGQLLVNGRTPGVRQKRLSPICRIVLT